MAGLKRLLKRLVADRHAQYYRDYLRATFADRISKIATRVGAHDGVFYDVGSNCGFFTRDLLAHGFTGRFYLFEPARRYFRYGRKLLAGRDEVRVSNVAASDVAGEGVLYVSQGPNLGWNTLVGAKRTARMREERVRLERLDDVDAPDPTFVKIDVEGYESKVLSGMMERIERCRPLMLVEIGWGRTNPLWGDMVALYERLTASGYEVRGSVFEDIDFLAIDETTDVFFCP